MEALLAPVAVLVVGGAVAWLVRFFSLARHESVVPRVEEYGRR